jgi:phospholipid transport system substrate-binding protein
LCAFSYKWTGKVLLEEEAASADNSALLQLEMNPAMKKYLTGLCLCYLLLLQALPVQASHDAQLVVMQAADQVMLSLRAEDAAMTSDQARLHNLINEHIMPHVDFEHMSRWALGRYWRQATPSEQQQFIQQFRQLLLHTYASALLEFAKYDISYQPVRVGNDDTDVTVHSQLQQAGGPPVAISYRMHLRDGHWLAYDISIEGISLLTNYRSSFASELRRTNLEHLIQQLASKNQAALQAQK